MHFFRAKEERKPQISHTFTTWDKNKHTEEAASKKESDFAVERESFLSPFFRFDGTKIFIFTLIRAPLHSGSVSLDEVNFYEGRMEERHSVICLKSLLILWRPSPNESDDFIHLCKSEKCRVLQKKPTKHCSSIDSLIGFLECHRRAVLNRTVDIQREERRSIHRDD